MQNKCWGKDTCNVLVIYSPLTLYGQYDDHAMMVISSQMFTSQLLCLTSIIIYSVSFKDLLPHHHHHRPHAYSDSTLA